MIFASWGPLGAAPGALLGRLGGFLGRLAAILTVVERSIGDSNPSWPVLGASWGPLGPYRRPLAAKNSRGNTRHAPEAPGKSGNLGVRALN